MSIRESDGRSGRRWPWVLLALIGLALVASAAFGADRFGCRLAYRPPQADYWFGHILHGCRSETDLTPTTRAWPVGQTALEALWGLRRLILMNEGADPLSLPESLPASFCDRMHLWAEDEGDRAPAMTRQQKIRQACYPGR